MADSTRKTANLLNNNPATQGDGYINNAILQQNDTVVTTNSFWVTEYIPITEGTYYYYNDLHRSTSSYINFYDNAKTNIGSALQKAAMTQESFNLSSFTAPTNTAYIRMNIDKQSTQNCLYTSQLPAYEPYGWVHSLRKLTTATEAVENPLYSDGTAITAYTIKGNTTQSGTPTPSNPVEVNGVGELANNLFNKNTALLGYEISTTAIVESESWAVSDYIPVEGNTHYIGGAFGNAVLEYESKSGSSVRINSKRVTDGFTTESTTRYIRINLPITNLNYAMFNEGETVKPYEPYGYKIPILNAQQTTNIYLGSTQTTRQIKKYVFTGNETVRTYDTTYSRIFVEIPNFVTFGNRATPIISTHYQGIYDERPIGNVPMNSVYSGSVGDYGVYIKEDGYTSSTDFKDYLTAQYNAGTPVTVWYVLATPQTATVNEPLMKIGDYADTLSNATAIPTTEGANSITVDTTVQPSEFTATWSGWHDASVKEKSENLWNEEYPDLSSTAIYVPLNVGEGNFTLSTNFQAINNTTDIFLLSGNVTSGISSSDNGAYAGKNVTKASIGGYVTVAYRKYAQPTTGALPYCEVMLNSGSTALPYAPYWE